LDEHCRISFAFGLQPICAEIARKRNSRRCAETDFMPPASLFLRESPTVTSTKATAMPTFNW
jgi:hypothetical protein